MARRKRSKELNYKMLEVIVLLLFGIGLLISVLKLGNKSNVPLSYNEYIEKYSKENRVEKELIAAIIYQESKFDKDAHSNRDARGLMQIIPETGKWVSQKLKMEDYSSENLFDPETNIKIGSKFIKHLLEYYDGNEKLAIAAYNAGPGNVDAWLKDGTVTKNGDYSEIPFEETRHYVEIVQKMKKVYKEMYPNDFKDEINKYENDYTTKLEDKKTTVDVTEDNNEQTSQES